MSQVAQTPKTERCVGCYVQLPVVDGPTHRYMDSSPACWAMYGEFLAGRYDRPVETSLPLAVDAYAAQHPGRDIAPAVSSAAIHLVVLELICTRAHPVDSGVQLRRRASELSKSGQIDFHFLDPPPQAWEWTLADVVAEVTTEEQWCRSVLSDFQAWHAPTIASWASLVEEAG